MNIHSSNEKPAKMEMLRLHTWQLKTMNCPPSCPYQMDNLEYQLQIPGKLFPEQTTGFRWGNKVSAVWILQKDGSRQ
jgi:hypothetical protein